MSKLLLAIVFSFLITSSSNAENTIPEFRFYDQNQKIVTPKDLLGKYWVLNFFFTSCPKVCPMLNGKVFALNQKFKNEPNLNFLSVSVDPDRDTFPVLLKYAEKFKAPSSRWQFARGASSEVTQLVADLKLAAGPSIDEHNSRLTLIDPEGKIIGYYSGLDQEGFAELDQKLTKIFQ